MDPTPDTEPTFTTDLPGIELGASLGKIFISLVILTCLMVATLWLIRRIIQGRTRVANATQMIQILEKRTLSPKTMLYVVSIDGEKHLVAESQVEIRSLGKITKEI